MRMGNSVAVDGMVADGLWDAFNDCHMGMAAEKCSSDHKISREEQDKYAIASYERALVATKTGAFNAEILPIEVKGRKVCVCGCVCASLLIVT